MSGWLGRLASSILGNPADPHAFRSGAVVALFDGRIDVSQDVRVYDVAESPVEADTVVVAPAGNDLLYRKVGPVAATFRHAFHVQSLEHWNDGTAVGIIRLAFVARLPGVDPASFRQRYEAHAEIAREHHPAICRYVQHFVRHGTHRDVAAIAELHFADEETMRDRFYRDETSPAVVAADIADYLDRERTWSMLIRPRA